MKMLRIIPVALFGGFLAGHGFQLTPELLPVVIVGALVYLSAALLEMDRIDERPHHTSHR